MNKLALIKKVAEKTALKEKDVEQTLEAIIGAITDELKVGGEVSLVGFGSFIAKKRHSRAGINPQRPTERIQIPEVLVAKFKTGKHLKDALKNVQQA